MSNPWDNDPVAPWAADPIATATPSATAPVASKYQQEALAEAARSKAAGVDTSYGLPARALNGAMFEGLPTVAAALEAPIEMARHGTLSPAEGYSYAKAKQDLALQQSRQNQGIAGTVADLGGGLMSGSAATRAGLTFAKAGAGVLGTAAGMAGDGAVYGGLSGALGGGDSLSDRAKSAALGAGVGFGLGGAMPILGAGVSAVASPVVSNIAARANPEGFAGRQVARAISESGQNVEQLQHALDSATAAGQSNFALADALGNPGQRMLSTVTRSPGAGRTDAVNFLENRQAGQGRDLSNILAQGLGAPDTAAQLVAALTAQRTSDAAANYGAARAGAGAVDATPAIQAADSFLSPGATGLMNPGSTIADDSVEGAVRRARSYLTGQNGEQVSDFSTALRSKQEIDNLIDRGTPAQQRQLIPMRNALDDQLAAASPAYADARNTFRQQSRAIDAVGTGRSAAMRGRPEDTIPVYDAMSSGAMGQQAPYRVGYADPLMEALSNSAPGVNKARPLLNDGVQAELGAMSQHAGPYQPGATDPMLAGIDRSNTMFETRAQALGGSKTADNLADQAASGLDPVVIAHALSGSPSGIVHGALRAAGNALTGSTPATREALGRLLLMHGAGADIAGTLSPLVQQNIARAALIRGLSAGGQVGAGNLIADQSRASR